MKQKVNMKLIKTQMKIVFGVQCLYREIKKKLEIYILLLAGISENLITLNPKVLF